jgi:hypothetical protein
VSPQSLKIMAAISKVCEPPFFRPHPHRSHSLCHPPAQCIGQVGGGALVIDYGGVGGMGSTMQAVKQHKSVHVLHM